MDPVTLGMAKAAARKSFATRRTSSPVVPGYDPAARAEFPRVVKPLDGPVISFTAQPAVTMYWPWLVDLSVDGVGSGYAWFWSTDHADVSADSGLFAASGPTPFAVTRQHGRIYRDDTQNGGQTETPSVIWAPELNVWLIFYHRAGLSGVNANQVTELATAPAGQLLNGAAWTRVGVIGDAATPNSPVPGAMVHHGYFRPFRYAGGWYAYSLLGGTFGGMQLLRSHDGLTWTSIGRMGYQGAGSANIPGFDPQTFIMKWTWTAIIEWRGKPWAIIPVTGEAAGTDTAPASKVGVAVMSPDFRRPISQIRDVTPAPQAWEQNAIDSMGNAVSYGDRILIPYRSNGKFGHFSLLEVV